MALVVNYTPDEIEWLHVGIVGRIKPGEIQEYPDARAAHILNKYGPRGLLRYRLDADEESLRKEAMRLYKRFWMNQITTFNQQNEARKNENRPYVFPTPELEEKAREFGVELVAPWKMQPQTESQQVSELKQENAELKAQIEALKEGQKEMLEALREIRGKPAVPAVVDTAELVKKFVTLGKDRYMNWLLTNAEEVEKWPVQVREKAKEKWVSFYPDKDWPLSD